MVSTDACVVNTRALGTFEGLGAAVCRGREVRSLGEEASLLVSIITAAGRCSLELGSLEMVLWEMNWIIKSSGSYYVWFACPSC